MLDKLAAIQILGVHLPITDGRMLIRIEGSGLSSNSEPNEGQRVLLDRLGLTLPPRITAASHIAGPAFRM